MNMYTFSVKYRPLEIGIHIISWFLIFSFPIMISDWGSEFDIERCMRHFIVPSCSFLTFYVNYFYLIPRCLFKNKVKHFLLLNLLLIVGMTCIIHLGHSVLSVPPVHDLKPKMPPPLPHHRWMFIGRDLIMMVFVTCLSTAIRLSIRWRKTEERLKEIEQQKTEAELKNLKYQLNPHFLLNTLNNIYALITFNSNKAQEAVMELSKLLRHVLYDNQSSFVPLDKELSFINNYISLMRIRLSQSVEVSVTLDAGPKPLQIAPLIFISLIENAFKHGISPTEKSFIHITITGHEDGKVCCEITNSYFPKNMTDKSGSGIGLEQVYQRLELSYPNRYEWNKETNEDRSIYTSYLIIQTTEL